jgi:glycosyltransferase involved in cell wall biosynthesis
VDRSREIKVFATKIEVQYLHFSYPFTRQRVRRNFDMKKTKVVYVVSEIEKSLGFEWIAQTIDRTKFELVFFIIGKKNTELAAQLTKEDIAIYEFSFNRKSNLVGIFIKIVFRFFQLRPNVIHTHLFYANLLGLTAGWLAFIPKRVYSRHHAMVHYDEYPKGLKWDKYCNFMATHIIAISNNVKNILIEKDKARPKKIHIVHHGFQLSYFQNVDNERVRVLKEKYHQSPQHFPVIGVISRYLKLKGIQYILPAFKKLKGKYPNAHLILVNTRGNYSDSIRSQLSQLASGSFTEIEFEYDLIALYKLFDVFVHVPIDAASEAFGQTYVESLASGVPSVFTLSGVAPEFIVPGQNALVVPFCDSESIYLSIVRILQDGGSRNTLIMNGKKSAELFPLSKMVNQLEKIYQREIRS